VYGVWRPSLRYERFTGSCGNFQKMMKNVISMKGFFENDIFSSVILINKIKQLN
jgi:hypothetical protein